MATLGFKGLDTGTGMTRGNLIPTKILEQDGLMSDTSEAYECFTYQKASSKLQAFLVNYVISVTSPYPIYG